MFNTQLMIQFLSIIILNSYPDFHQSSHNSIWTASPALIWVVSAGIMIMLETGPIERFESAGNYASYCRGVGSRRQSNEKKKGQNNRKNGNKYLAWAFVEAANYAKRYYPEACSWFNRKKARTNRIVATKALACKLSKAAYYILRDNVEFDMEKMF